MANVPGYVRGFDVRTGQELWRFNTIPQAGEKFRETWEKDSWKYTGNAGVWAPFSADDALGYVYLPVERRPATSTAGTASATTSTRRAWCVSTCGPAR